MIEQCLVYGTTEIPYKVFYTPTQYHKISIHVLPDGTVHVDAPQKTPLTEIKLAVSKRGQWLNNHLKLIKQHYAYVLPREYVSGESHLYLGRRYVLKVYKNNGLTSVKLRNGQFQITTMDNSPENIKTLLWNWYKEHALQLFSKRLESICNNLSWVKQQPEWKLLKMKKQWGSCSPKGTLNLNPHLVKAPTRCIDYVLTHELCHLKVHNHSPQFYRLLSTQMPDWESAKAQLDGMAELLLNE